MPLRKIQFIQNCYYHVYNRGSEKRLLFLDDRDYRKFSKRMKEYSEFYRISILCYCLMHNHFHFLLRQDSDLSIALFMNVLQLAYAKYFNTKYVRIGPLYQGRFKAKIIESDEYLLQLSAYIHKNPISLFSDSGNPQDSQNLLYRLRNYPYSSYREYLNPYFAEIAKPKIILDYFSKTNKNLYYQAFVEQYEINSDKIYPLTLDY